jgi:hypothetical protein
LKTLPGDRASFKFSKGILFAKFESRNLWEFEFESCSNLQRLNGFLKKTAQTKLETGREYGAWPAHMAQASPAQLWSGAGVSRKRKKRIG